MSGSLIGYHFSGPEDTTSWPPLGGWQEGGQQAWMEGLFACPHPYDAVVYAAAGPFLHRVEIAEVTEPLADPRYPLYGARRRRRLATVDASLLVAGLSRYCALLVAADWGAPPLVKEYLTTGAPETKAEAHQMTREAIARRGYLVPLRLALQASGPDMNIGVLGDMLGILPEAKVPQAKARFERMVNIAFGP